MTHSTAKKQGLDPVYPESHELGTRVFYDTAEGKYYDSASDVYLELTNILVPGNYYAQKGEK